MATLARLRYKVARTVASLTSLQARLASVELPFDDLKNIGLSVVNDSTSISGNFAVREIDISLLSAFQAFNATTIPVNDISQFQGSIVSSSPEDSQNGTGLRFAKIIYAPVGNDPSKNRELTVALNGTTPVNLLNDGHIHHIVDIIPIRTGSFGTNVGLISIYTELNVRPGIVNFQLPNNFQGSILSSNPNDRVGGAGAQQITISYRDVLGNGPFVEVVNLNGTIPVDLVSTDHFTVESMTVILSGPQTQNLGYVTIFSGLKGTGGPVARLEPSYFSYFSSDSAFFGPFVELYEQIISNKLTSVVESEPVMLI